MFSFSKATTGGAQLIWLRKAAAFKSLFSPPTATPSISFAFAHNSRLNSALSLSLLPSLVPLFPLPLASLQSINTKLAYKKLVYWKFLPLQYAYVRRKVAFPCRSRCCCCRCCCLWMFVCILQQEIRQIAAVTGMEKLPPFCVFCVCRFFMRKFDWRRMSS